MDHTITTNHIISNDISADLMTDKFLCQIAAESIDFLKKVNTATFLTTIYIHIYRKIFENIIIVCKIILVVF